MAFSWGDFLALAASLATSSDEAVLRTATSRAYYAAYHRARSRLGAHGLKLLTKDPASGKRLSSHEAVWRTYLLSTTTSAQLGVDGNRLKLVRVKADYHLPAGVDWVKTAAAAVLDASSLMKRL